MQSYEKWRRPTTQKLNLNKNARGGVMQIKTRSN